jgi:hypothetical protein
VSREVRLYVEGGGDGKDARARLRIAFGEFLREVRHLAREERAGWSITVCGSRESAFEDFQTALRKHPDAFVVLLVDAEGSYAGPGPWQHLADPRNDGWKKPPGVEDDQCHLMVQVMEAWFLADRDKLAEYYGQGFLAGSLPNNPDVEQIPKDRVLDALATATRNTQKGSYHKTRHAPKILERIRPEVVCNKAAQCRRLLEALRRAVAAGS